MYRKFVKRILDVVLSSIGMVLFSPFFLLITICILIDDPGTVFFSQKRVGMNRNGETAYFQLYKFRSMKMATPHDVPTHMLDHPEQYITKVGKFLRAHSLDELPQIWNIFIGDMSIVGPRPALWNQFDLIQEREKYGANDVRPGLTGWAQVNGRDELAIKDKARLDGDYVKQLSFLMDCKCFFRTLHVFGGDQTIVEGNTTAFETKTKESDL